MNSRRYSPNYVDTLFRQALQPYVGAQAPDDGWQRVLAQLQQPVQPRWQRIFLRFGIFRFAASGVPEISELFPAAGSSLALSGLFDHQRQLRALLA